MTAHGPLTICHPRTKNSFTYLSLDQLMLHPLSFSVPDHRRCRRLYLGDEGLDPSVPILVKTPSFVFYGKSNQTLRVLHYVYLTTNPSVSTPTVSKPSTQVSRDNGLCPSVVSMSCDSGTLRQADSSRHVTYFIVWSNRLNHGFLPFI